MFDPVLTLSLDNDRHFVVGDIHGRMDMFLKLLDNINYDPSTDVIYTVGDMIDRGPKSLDVVNFFLNNPRCYAIKGNHEHMMLTKTWYETWINNGGMSCLADLKQAKVSHDWLKDRIYPLPWTIDVGEEDEEGSFRVVHAGIPSGWSEQTYQKALKISLNGDDPNFAPLIWSRRMCQTADNNIYRNRLSDSDIIFANNRSKRMVFAGHTPIQRAIKCHDHWFIDTWRGRTMTMINALTHERHVTYQAR
jgi:hypothetical protein